MIAFAVTAGILLLLIALILLLPSQLGVEYENQDGKQKLVLHIRVLMIPLKIRIPVIKDAEKKEKKKEKKKAKEQPEQKMSLDRFRTAAAGLQKAYEESKEDMKDIWSLVRSKAEFQAISFRLDFGLADAAKTGIATGAAWAASSCILSVFDHLFGIREKQLDVSPDFNREHFHLYVKSILRLRPVHIISIGIRIIQIVNLFIEKMDIK